MWRPYSLTPAGVGAKKGARGVKRVGLFRLRLVLAIHQLRRLRQRRRFLLQQPGHGGLFPGLVVAVRRPVHPGRDRDRPHGHDGLRLRQFVRQPQLLVQRHGRRLVADGGLRRRRRQQRGGRRRHRRVPDRIAAIAVAGELRHQRRPGRHDDDGRRVGEQPGQRRRLVVHQRQRLVGVGRRRRLGVGRRLGLLLRLGGELVVRRQSERTTTTTKAAGRSRGTWWACRRPARRSTTSGASDTNTWGSNSWWSSQGSGSGSGSSASTSGSNSSGYDLDVGYPGFYQGMGVGAGGATDAGWRWGVGWPGAGRNGPLGPSAYSGLGYVFTPGNPVSRSATRASSSTKREIKSTSRCRRPTGASGTGGPAAAAAAAPRSTPPMGLPAGLTIDPAPA